MLFVVLRVILYVTVCCVLQIYKQLRCTFGPSQVFSNNEKDSKRAVSNVCLVFTILFVCLSTERRNLPPK